MVYPNDLFLFYLIGHCVEILRNANIINNQFSILFVFCRVNYKVDAYDHIELILLIIHLNLHIIALMKFLDYY